MPLSASVCLSHPAPRSRSRAPGPPQIVSGSRDKTIKLWNTLGECKYTIGEPDGHTEWVSCVRFSPVTANPIIVSAGWDKAVKVRGGLSWGVVGCGVVGARMLARVSGRITSAVRALSQNASGVVVRSRVRSRARGSASVLLNQSGLLANLAPSACCAAACRCGA